MARATFGGGIADFVTQSIGGGILKLNSATLTFWSARTGGTRYSDLRLNGSAASTISVGADGQVPQFQGPDGVYFMWADGGGGRVQMVAVADAVALATAPADTTTATNINTPGSATATALAASIEGTATPIVQGAISDEATRADATYAPKPDTLWIPAPDFWPVVGTEERGYGGTNTPHASYGWLLADDGSDFNHSEGASYMLKFPAGWSSATVDVYWAPIGTGGGNVAWRAVIYNVASGNAFDVGSVGAATGATGASTVANRLKITQLSGNLTVDPTQLSRIQIIRNITSASDTLTGDVLFAGVLIHRVA